MSPEKFVEWANANIEKAAVKRQELEEQRNIKRQMSQHQRDAEIETQANKKRFFADRGLSEATDTAKKKAWKAHLREQRATEVADLLRAYYGDKDE